MQIKLWKHQEEIIARAVPMQNYALFAEMGTGKSCASIQILRHWCAQHKRVLRTLVLCPPVVCHAWQREFVRFSKLGQHVTVLTGEGKKRTKLFDEKAFEHVFGRLAQPGIFITNFEALSMPELFKLLKEWQPEVLIVDEAHKCKSIESKRTKFVIELADKAQHKLILTGTPILNSGMDIWAQYRVLDGGETFDRNFYAFRARWFEDKNAGMPSHKHFPDWRPRPGTYAAFNDLIYRKATRVLKKDCLDLPPLVRQRLEVELAPDQARMVREMERDFVTYLKDKACVAQIALTKGLRLQQMVSGFFVDEQGEEHTYKKNPRMDALGELLADVAPAHKVIVWTNFRASYEPILELCKKLKLPAVSLYGGMTDKRRQESIDNFQTEKDVRVMVANPAAGGVGVTLTAASYMVYYSRGFHLEHDLQSEARCHRGGSEIFERITRIDIVAEGTIDEVILDALARKESLANNILRLRELL